jgi:hypothetical protein
LQPFCAGFNGLPGETSTVDKMHRRVQYDLDYLKNWSCGWISELSPEPHGRLSMTEMRIGD